MPSNWTFIKRGLPFFALVIGSATGLIFFQRIKFEYKESKHKQIAFAELASELKNKGKNIKDKPQTPEEIYLEFEKSGAWNDDYKNVRGPHIGEDNKEWNQLISGLKSKYEAGKKVNSDRNQQLEHQVKEKSQ